MKTALFFLIVVCKLNIAFAQDSTDYYIKNLGWHSLFLKQTYVSQLVLSKEAEKLIPKKNEQTINRLFCALADDKKTAVTHMILSRMFNTDSLGLNHEYVYSGDSVVAVTYIFNTLKWRYDVKSGKYSIEPEAVKRIQEYWKRKLPKLQNINTKAPNSASVSLVLYNN